MVPARNGQKMEYFLVVFVYEKLKHAVLPESENNMTDVFIKKDVEEVIVNPAPQFAPELAITTEDESTCPALIAKLALSYPTCNPVGFNP